MANAVKTEVRGPVHWIWINREERRNALNDEVVLSITAALEAAEADAGCRAIVLTGAGDKAFCAGGDLSADSGGPFGKKADPRHPIIRMFRRMEACPLPIVARVNGLAMAGGLGLLCACDLAVAVSSARFGTPEVTVGLFPMMILPHMQRVLPIRRLFELCLTGEPIDAAEAKEIGLVNYVVPPEELDAKLEWLLGRITPKSPTAIRLGKIGFRALQDMTTDQAFEYAQLMIARLAATEDAAEGFAAFREKRKPVWTGR